jgi:hypothetical protein
MGAFHQGSNNVAHEKMRPYVIPLLVNAATPNHVPQGGQHMAAWRR